MKKIICLILFLLSLSVNVSFAKNDACTSGSKLLVLQVLDDGVLGAYMSTCKLGLLRF